MKTATRARRLKLAARLSQEKADAVRRAAFTYPEATRIALIAKATFLDTRAKNYAKQAGRLASNLALAAYHRKP